MGGSLGLLQILNFLEYLLLRFLFLGVNTLWILLFEHLFGKGIQEQGLWIICSQGSTHRDKTIKELEKQYKPWLFHREFPAPRIISLLPPFSCWAQEYRICRVLRVEIEWTYKPFLSPNPWKEAYQSLICFLSIFPSSLLPSPYLPLLSSLPPSFISFFSFLFFLSFFLSFSSLCSFFKIFIGVYLLYNVVLVSTVQQSESAIRIHVSNLFWISFPFRSPQSTE